MASVKERWFIGIDLGTTSVKLSLIDVKSRIIIEKDRPHNAQRECGKQQNEQCPKQIIRTLHEMLLELNGTISDQLYQLLAIGVSGQMHGVVLWNSQSLTSLESVECSQLITWMDGRCDEEFLKKLPKWTDQSHSNDGEKRICSGYGWPTLAWMKANCQLDPKWDRAGTVMDFFVAFLTQSTGEVLMCTQNAESWGYAADGNGHWTIEDKHEDIFPLYLLPRIVEPGTIIGKTSGAAFGPIPQGIPVLVPLGDLQATLLPILGNGEAALHIGTSAQLAFINPTASSIPIAYLPSSITKVPFFGGNSLWVAASLNGGNALDCFIGKIAEWSRQLFGSPSIEQQKKHSKSALLEQILQSENASSSSSLFIRPTFFGERHHPMAGVRLDGLRAETPLEEILRSIARGIVQNLADLMPPTILGAHRITRLKLVGRAKQQIFAREAKRLFPDMELVEEEKCMSAAFGAAMHAKQAFVGNDE